MCAKLWFNETLTYLSRSFLLEVDMEQFGVFLSIWLFLIANYLLLRIGFMPDDEDIHFGG